MKNYSFHYMTEGIAHTPQRCYVVRLVYFPNHYLLILCHPSTLLSTFISAPFFPLRRLYFLSSCFIATVKCHACKLPSVKVSFFPFLIRMLLSNKVKGNGISLCLIKPHTAKAYGGVEV